MNAPIEIIEDGRITVTHYVLNNKGKEEEHVSGNATFLVRFDNSDKYYRLKIDTDKTFKYAWSFSLGHGPRISGPEKPEWVMTILRTLNMVEQEYNDAEPRTLRLVESRIPGQYCYEALPLSKSPTAVADGRLFSPVQAVRGPSFVAAAGVDVLSEDTFSYDLP